MNVDYIFQKVTATTLNISLISLFWRAKNSLVLSKAFKSSKKT